MEDRMNDRTTPKIGVLIVIYNRRCDASVSVMSMVKESIDAFVLADNSTDKEIVDFNRVFCRKNGVDYCSMDGNAGLPKAYNRAAKAIRQYVDYLMILDDDTLVPNNVTESLKSAILQHSSADIFLPYTYDAKGLLSPNRRRDCLFFRLRQRPDQFASKMSAINSGMVIRVDGKDSGEPLFDESQFLDCVDHLFILRELRKGSTFQMYSAVFKQTFFDSEEKSRDDMLPRAFARFSGFVKDYVIFCRLCSLNMLLARVYLVFRAGKLNVRYRTVRFFRALRTNI